MVKLTATANAVTFDVRVQPRASRSEIVGELDGALKVRLAAPPVDGAANKELIRLLANFFAVPRANIELLSGATNKNKIIRVKGLNENEAEQKLKAQSG